MTKLIVGLGNPGSKYQSTRHNLGFMILDRLAEKLNASWSEDLKTLADVAELNLDGVKVILAKPMTYMNKSGEAVGALARKFKVESGDVWVAHDDVDLPFGRLRVRLDGSAGGHKGVQSVIDSLQANDFVRLKVGVGGTPEKMALEDWVLSKFTKEELDVLEGLVEQVTNKIIDAIKSGSLENITENLE
ncbi:MAG: aminoacyl-tRNA hydrolase [Candidatus Uhrbacteria bacterium]|nr:aminoacyl-tRNA hydrolase [Candidatus Uhrbacteria bacterium]